MMVMILVIVLTVGTFVSTSANIKTTVYKRS